MPTFSDELMRNDRVTLAKRSQVTILPEDDRPDQSADRIPLNSHSLLIQKGRTRTILILNAIIGTSAADSAFVFYFDPSQFRDSRRGDGTTSAVLMAPWRTTVEKTVSGRFKTFNSRKY
jgi:hypothetical protein